MCITVTRLVVIVTLLYLTIVRYNSSIVVVGGSMKTAQELRGLKLVKPNPNLFDIASEEINKAHDAGLTQVTIKVPQGDYSHSQALWLKGRLKKLGYRVLVGSTSGFLTTNLIVQPTFSVTVVW